MPAATRTTRMLQASTAHADFKHACTCVPFLPRGIQRPNAAGPDAQNGPIGRKGLKRAAPPAGRNARSAPQRHDAPAAAAPARATRSRRRRYHPAHRPRCARRCRCQRHQHHSRRRLCSALRAARTWPARATSAHRRHLLPLPYQAARTSQRPARARQGQRPTRLQAETLQAETTSPHPPCQGQTRSAAQRPGPPT